MDAATLILLILLLIGVVMTAYYAVICFQARPLTDKPPSQPDLGPLLRYEEDMNGNSEEEPIRASQPGNSLDQPDSSKESKPVDDVDLASSSKTGNDLDHPLKSVTFQTTPECAPKEPPKENPVILTIADEPSLLDGSKSVLPPPGSGSIGPAKKQTSPMEEPVTTKPSGSVSIPIMSETPLQAMSVGYEEDGLLVPETPKQCQPEIQPPEDKANKQKVINIENRPPHMYPQNPPPQFPSQPQPQHSQPYSTLPKHVHFTTPFMHPQVVDSSSQPGRQPKPALKSLHSDPGTVKNENFVHFGTKHKSEENIGIPTKKVKMNPKEEENKPCEAYDFSKEIAENYPTARKSSAPAIGWSFNFSKGKGNTCEEKTSEDVNDDPKVEKTVPLETNPEGNDLRDTIKTVDAEPIDSISKNKTSNVTKSEIPFVVSTPKTEIGYPQISEIITVEEPVTLEELQNQSGNSKPEEVSYDDDADIVDDDENLERPPSNSNDTEVDAPIKVKVLLPNEDTNEPKETKTTPESPDETESESSDPDVTEYSFQRGSYTPEPKVADVLANEVSSFQENKVGLTNYVPIAEPVEFHNKPTQENYLKFGEHPPTPTSDTTKTPSPDNSHNTSLDGMSTPTIHANVLGTPPVTPPENKNSPAFIIGNNSGEIMDSLPTFIILEPHNSRERLSSSSSSSSSSSTSNGSYKIDGVKEFNDVQMTKSECKSEMPQVTKLKK